MELWLNRPIGPRWIVDVAEPLAINKHQLRLAVGKRRENMRGHFGKLNEGHDAKPPETTVSQVPTRILFAPDHSPEMEIMKQMLKATTRIDFAMFTFAESSGIDDTMKVLASNGVQVQGVLDWKASKQKWAANHGLKAYCRLGRGREAHRPGPPGQDLPDGCRLRSV